MNLRLLESCLISENLLSNLIYFETIDSTNLYSKRNELPDNTLILTSHQTEGKGRFERCWSSSKNKDLTFTLIKSFRISVDGIHLINFYTSYILFLTLKDLLDNHKNDYTHDLILKWPNDIMLNKKKVAGILIDIKDINYESKKFAIGIGVNVNQENFSDELIAKATSLLNETNCFIECENLLIQFIKRYYTNLNLISDKTRLMDLWVSNSKISGTKIMFRHHCEEIEKSATVLDIGLDGSLIVRFDNGTVSNYYSGEIRIFTIKQKLY